MIIERQAQVLKDWVKYWRETGKNEKEVRELFRKYADSQEAKIEKLANKTEGDDTSLRKEARKASIDPEDIWKEISQQICI